MLCRGRFGRRLAVLCSLALLALPGGAAPAAAFEIGETFEVGHWAGHAQYSEEDGGFSLCLISAEFDNGVSLAFLRKDDGLAFFLSDPRWQLTQYETYPLTVSIDRLWSQRLEGRAVLHSVVVDLGQDLRAWDALRRGRRLSVVTEARRFSFVLDGSARALDRLEQCFREHSRATRQAGRNPFAGEANPFIATPAPARPPAGARPPQPSMQRAQLSGLLQKVVGVEFWVRPATDVDPEFQFDYLYGVGDLLVGWYVEAMPDGRSAERVLTDVLENLEQSCAGPFVSGTRAAEDSARGRRVHGSHACKADDFFADATVIVWKNGYVSVFVNTTDMADAQVAEEISTAVGTALAP
jgi:hypothetical protein